MAARMSDQAVKEATGRKWDEWFALLDGAGMREMTHQEIISWLIDSKNLDLRWWGQMVTVEYERHIGRRSVGQRNDGAWTANCSRTMSCDMDQALAVWCAAVDGRSHFNEVPVIGEPRISSTPKWRYWRCDLADGSTVSVNISEKPGSKSSVAIDHGKISDEESSRAWKSYWKGKLAGL